MRPAWRPWVVAGTLLTFGFGACDAPLGPAVPFDEPPALQGFSIDDFFLRDGGVLALSSVPVDPAFDLPAGTYLTVEVWTSRSDAEEVRLGRMMCGEYTCHRAFISMKPGLTVLAIEEEIHSLGARLTLLSISNPPEWGGAWVLNGRAKSFRGQLSRHPDVAYIELEAPFTTDPLPPDWSRYVAGGLPVADVPIVVRNGTLSLTAGDTIFYRYIDLVGDTLSHQWVVWALAP